MFSRGCGGVLACPATAEQFASLRTYLAAITTGNDNGVVYHLGLVADPHRHTFRWLSGDRYQWHNWRLPEDVSSGRDGIPCFNTGVSPDNAFWHWQPDPSARHYSVIAWSNGP